MPNITPPSNSSGRQHHDDGVRRILADLHQRYQAVYDDQLLQPLTEYIDDWHAPCYDGEVRYGLIPWKAVLQQPETAFDGVEQGLECKLNEQVKTFYQSFFAADLHLSFESHPLTLSQVMCVEDVERLQRNLIAHVLMKRRLGQPVTLFIGTGEESEDLIISVDNDTGVVGLEYAGQPHHCILASSLAEFLTACTPRVVTQEE